MNSNQPSSSLPHIIYTHIEYRGANCTSDRIAAVRVEVLGFAEGTAYVRSRAYGAEGVAVADALGHDDDVGDDAVTLEAPEVGARAAEARLHLVRDQQAAERAHVLVDPWQVVAGVLYRATDALELGNVVVDEVCVYKYRIYDVLNILGI